MSFIEAAMVYAVDRNWTYYIGGSNYKSFFPSDVHVTPFTYCPSSNNAGNPGKIIFSNFQLAVEQQKSNISIYFVYRNSPSGNYKY